MAWIATLENQVIIFVAWIKKSKWPLEQNIITDVRLTNLPLWESGRIPILGIWRHKSGEWIYSTTSVQTDSVNIESVVRCGQRCTPCTMNSKIGNSCDTMTQLCCTYEFIRNTVFHRIPVRRWFPTGNWCVLVGTEVIQMYFMYGCYHSWTELSRCKRAGFNLYRQ